MWLDRISKMSIIHKPDKPITWQGLRNHDSAARDQKWSPVRQPYDIFIEVFHKNWK